MRKLKIMVGDLGRADGGRLGWSWGALGGGAGGRRGARGGGAGWIGPVGGGAGGWGGGCRDLGGGRVEGGRLPALEHWWRGLSAGPTYA